MHQKLQEFQGEPFLASILLPLDVLESQQLLFLFAVCCLLTVLESRGEAAQFATKTRAMAGAIQQDAKTFMMDYPTDWKEIVTTSASTAASDAQSKCAELLRETWMWVCAECFRRFRTVQCSRMFKAFSRVVQPFSMQRTLSPSRPSRQPS